MTEEHDIVYRDAPRRRRAGAAAAAAPADATYAREIVPDPVLLFRYSALTFNGHRIHYDRRYVTEVEGYPGAGRARTADRDAAARQPAAPRARTRDVRRFAFKAVRPLFDIAPVHGLRPRRRRGHARAVGARPRGRARDAGERRAGLTIERATTDDGTRTSATPCARCARSFPDEYFRKVDARARLPRGVRRRADQGRLARRADPAGVRRLGAGPRRGVGDHGGDQPLGRQRRRVPRPDVQHGHAAAPRHRRRRSSEYLPKIASGELRLQSMAVTEPTTGTDTTKIKTTAVRKGDRYVVNGQKVWISRVQHSDLMILLARTTPLDAGREEIRGHVDLPRRPARGDRPRADGAADREHGEPRDQRALLRQPRGPRREPDRRGGQGLQRTSSTASTPSAR